MEANKSRFEPILANIASGPWSFGPYQYFNRCLATVGFWLSSSMSTVCVMPLREIKPFSAMLARSGWVGGSVISQGKIP